MSRWGCGSKPERGDDVVVDDAERAKPSTAGRGSRRNWKECQESSQGNWVQPRSCDLRMVSMGWYLLQGCEGAHGIALRRSWIGEERRVHGMR